MLRFSQKILLGFLPLILSAAAAAQFRFDRWTTDNGLPQNSVYSILQTGDGYIWFTTLDGLVRFDGVNFKIFNRGNSPGLTTNRLIFMFAEKDGTLWVGTEDGGLLRYSGGVFRAFTVDDGLPSNGVYRIYQDFDGAILAATLSGLARFDGEKFAAVNREEGRDYILYFSASGTRWEFSRNGLTSTKNNLTVNYELPFQINQISSDRTFNYPSYVKIIEDRNDPNVVWLTAAANLYRLENGVFTAFSQNAGMPKSLVRALVQEENGDIWLGTDAEGLCRFSGNRVKCLTIADGLSSNSIWDLMFDREKTLWVATNQYGINKVSRQTISSLSKKDGLFDGNVYPILETGENDYWIGAYSALSHYKNGAITNYTKQNGLPFEIVQTLFQDKNERLWIGSIGGVAYLENGKFSDQTQKLGFEFGKYNFWDIFQNEDGALWLATNLGLFRYQNDKIERFTIDEGLPSNDVKKILRTAKGELWFGTVGGLARFDNGKFEIFDERRGLPGNHVRTIYEDAENFLWIGTYDSGLALLRNGAITKITQRDGLFSDGVFQILPDERGNFWMSSNQGIYRVSRRQLIDFADGKISQIVSTAFGKSDGMLNVECNGGRQPAGIRASDGRLWFPTQDGVAIVDPDAVHFNDLPPPVIIENARIDNQNANVLANAVELLPGQQNLEIDYTGLSFIKPEQVRFRYRLEGLDENWTEAGNRRTAFFPHLAPGEYTFHVIAANSDNVWNEQGAMLKIVVKPAFYQHWIFYAVCIVVLIMLVYGIFRIRFLRLERARNLQEEFSRRLINAHESERRRIAAGLHDSLGQTLAMIKNRAVFAAQNSDDPKKSRAGFDQITEQSIDAINEVREISYNLRPYLLDRLGLTKALKSLFNKTAENSRFEIKAKIENIDGIFTGEEEINLYRIVQETLNNILKHADAKTVNIRIEKNAGWLRVSIADDGKGFSPNGVSDDNKKDGFGLFGIAERVKILGGVHTIESAPGNGTIVSFEIDISNKTNGKAN